MKRKVKKFGRGGDILTGVGAALIGKALYDKYTSKDEDKKDNRGSGLSFPKPTLSSEVDEAQRSSRRKETDESKEYDKRGKFPDEAGDGTSGGAPDERKSVVTKATPVKAVKAVKTTPVKPAKVVAAAKPAEVLDKKKPEKTDKTPPVFIPGRIASMDKGFPLSSDTGARQPTPPVSRYVREPDAAVEADKKQAAKNVVSSAKKPSQAFPINKAADEKAIQKAGGVRVDNKLPKGIDTKTGNKTVYGDTTTSVFQKRAAQERADKEAKAKQKIKSDAENKEFRERALSPMKKGGAVKKYASGGSVSSASRRADGIAIRGKTRA